jgi:hypothetical protein
MSTAELRPPDHAVTGLWVLLRRAPRALLRITQVLRLDRELGLVIEGRGGDGLA